MKDKWKRRLVGDHRDPREELAVIFGVTIPATDEIPPDVLGWARSRVDVSTMSQIEAVRALRDAEPRLGLTSALYLVRNVFAAR